VNLVTSLNVTTKEIAYVGLTKKVHHYIPGSLGFKKEVNCGYLEWPHPEDTAFLTQPKSRGNESMGYKMISFK
jgi:hypothetical protein